MALTELMKDSHEKHVKTIRKRIWYQRFMDLANLLKEEKCKNPVRVLKEFDMLLNRVHGYRYNNVARSAYETLEQVVIDMGWTWK